MNRNLDDQIARFRDWAECQPTLRRLWLFGSQARGTERLDSDIDLAFEIDPVVDDSNKDDFRTETLPRWKSQLQALSETPVQLEPWAFDATNVAAYVTAYNVLVYERAA